MKTLHYSILAILVFIIIIIVVIEFPLYRGPNPMMIGSKLYQENTTQTNAMANLGNDTGITTIGNQVYYFETPNYSHDAYFNSPQIPFHDVIFTLFPSGFRGGLPTNGCGGQYYWTDVKFSDGTSELLHIFVGSPQCSDSQPPTYFSTHTNPQAGLIFYDGKMKLLISVEEK